MASYANERQPFNGESMNIKNATDEVRRGFVRKVYGILSMQLLITVAIAAPLQTVSREWMRRNQWLMILSVVMTFVTICAMSCCRDLVKSYPTNYVLLLTFTGFEGVMVGFVSASYTWQSVVLAAGVTVIIFLGLTAFAWLSKTDFTGMGVYFFGLLMTLAAFGFVLMILGFCGIHIKWLMILYDVLGCLVFVGYIIFDTQMILGQWGGHKLEFGLDDYVFAALNLYLDIINLFLHLLRLFGDRR
mmetsp:Transcript_14016/g.31860  ORF Transcript_14016/g.31860 Transcript_14016/m.31860 type:complete len:245 (-) Transcript_14016:73-807(-)